MSSGQIRLGPLLLTQPVGRGGMGTVWHARHPEGVDVALKVLRPEYAGDADVLEAFRREVIAVASLDHPGVVRVFDYGVVPDAVAEASDAQITARSPWLSMEYAPQGTLGDRPAAESWRELRDTLVQVLDGLAHSHARGIIHRDLKPRNVLVHTASGRGGVRVSLTDYGIAHAVSQRTTHKAQAGTPGYMAPEQIRGDWRDLGPWTDLYSLGALAWRLATGRSPFHGDRPPTILYAQLNGKMGAFSPACDVPAGFEAWVKRMLAVDPGVRYASAADASAELTALEWGEADRRSIPKDWRPRHPVTRVRPNGTGLALFVLRPWPLVGRESTQDELWDALRDVAGTGVAQAVVLSGARGVGKSRLVAWLTERAIETGAAWVVQSSRRRRAGPVLARVAQTLFRTDELTVDEARARVVTWLQARGATDVDAEVARLSSLWNPESERGGSIDAWMGLLDRATVDRPVILVVDDLHREPEATRIVEAIVGTRRPVLVLGSVERTARPPHFDKLEVLRAQSRWVELRALSRQEQRELVDAGVGLDPRLADRVVDRTAGDPALAVKVIADWARRGMLVPTSTGFDLKNGSDARVAEPLIAELQTRLRGCADAEVTALELLSALGGKRIRELEWRLVCDEAEVPWGPDTVARLESAGHLVRNSRETTAIRRARAAGLEDDADRWTIEPPVLRDLLLQRAVLAERLKAHHEACATVLLRLPRASARERAVMHFVDAGLPSKALSTLRGLIDETERQGQWRRMPTLLASEGRLLDAMRISATDHRRLPNQIDLLFNDLAEGVPGDLHSARKLLDRTVSFGDPRLCARVARVVLQLEDETDQLHPDDPLLASAHKWAASTQDTRGQAVIHRLHGRAAWRDLDPETAERELEAGLGVAEDPVERARLLAVLGDVRGDAEDGDALLAEAATVLTGAGKHAEVLEVLLVRSRVARRRGDLVAALDHARAAQAQLRDQRADTTAADLQVGLARLARGEISQARTELAKAAEALAPAVVLTALGALLACSSISGTDWTEIDRRLAAWKALARDDLAVGGDTAWPLEWAAKRVVDAGAFGRAADLYGLAAHRYELARDDASVDRMRKKIRNLAPDTGDRV